jgi:NAD(P)H dehydrogenase (quinone)
MIAITGATGHLGRLTIAALIESGVDARNIVAVVRSLDKAADLKEKGLQIRQADYTQPQALEAALHGVQKLLLISSSDFNDRVGQHRHVIEAAQRAGVELLAYTSILKADSSSLKLAADHKATEESIRASGIPFVFLRNGWYFENYNLPQAVANGAVLGSAGNGRTSAAPRAEYAAAAAAALTKPNQQNTIYELGGDQSFTFSELAAELQKQSGKPVVYQNLPVEAYNGMLQSFGLPTDLAELLADADRGMEMGDLETNSGDLRDLIGKPTATMPEALRAALRGSGQLKAD